MVIEKRLEAYLEGASNVVKFCGIEKGNQVLIVCTPKTDRCEVDAVAYAARLVGARVSILEVEEKAPSQPYSPVMMAAVRAADFRIDMGAGPASVEKDGFIITYDYGVSNCAIRQGFLNHDAARYPVDLWYEINNRLKRRIGHTAPDARHIVNFRVIDANGSDFHIKIRYPEDIIAYVGPEPLLSGRGPRPRVCYRGGFPVGGCPAGDLLDSGKGVLVPEYFGEAGGSFGRLKSLLKLTFENGLAIDAQGGPEAERFREMLKAYPNANHLREFGIGSNPHLPLPPDLPAGIPFWASTRRAGVLYLGWGGDTGVGGTRVGIELFSYPMAINTTATIYADDEIIVDNGRLTVLKEPELWEIAKKYGDPAKLLTTV